MEIYDSASDEIVKGFIGVGKMLEYKGSFIREVAVLDWWQRLVFLYFITGIFIN